MPACAIRLLFAVTTFVAATLVFLVQPMVAKQLLPSFGGTPGVWNASVTFFQVALLVGYAAAHVSLAWLGVRRQVFLQVGLALAALAFLPFAVQADASRPDSVGPALWIAALLAAGVGVPYVVVAMASPVIQRWYASLGQADSDEPWFLYVASNAGSLLGLLAYPILLEPRLDTDAQELTWLAGFVAYLVGITACAVLVRRRTASSREGVFVPLAGTKTPSRPGAPIGALRSLRWLLLAAVPVALMLGVTTFITTDVASAPLLWVVPLALYLVSFIVTFGRRWRVGPRVAGIGAGASVMLVVLVELERIEVDELQRVAVHLVATFLASVLAHATLYADRPSAERLTSFYLLMSVGGAIGGSFISLAAPVLFDDVYEYPLLLALLLFARPAPRWRPAGPMRRMLLLVGELALAALAIAALAGAATRDEDFASHFAGDAWLAAVVVIVVVLLARWAGLVVLVTVVLALVAFGGREDSLLRDRNFFGTLRVEDDPRARRMLHGTTLHGTQLLDLAEARTPTTYYTAEGPVGDVFTELQRDEPFVEVGAVGLGTGTVLGFARIWQRFTFYEIDPAVIDAAKDPELFSWISGADVDVRIVEGDARQSLEDEERRFDLLVLDAYSSDAVPTHLLTVEAMRLYEDRLTSRGVMLLHISSRHLELEPVVAANVERLGFAARTRRHGPELDARVNQSATTSQWIAIAPTDEALGPLAADDDWQPLVDADGDDAWTDDFSNVADTIRWLPDWLR